MHLPELLYQSFEALAGDYRDWVTWMVDEKLGKVIGSGAESRKRDHEYEQKQFLVIQQASIILESLFEAFIASLKVLGKSSRL